MIARGFSQRTGLWVRARLVVAHLLHAMLLERVRNLHSSVFAADNLLVRN